MDWSEIKYFKKVNGVESCRNTKKKKKRNDKKTGNQEEKLPRLSNQEKEERVFCLKNQKNLFFNNKF